VRWGGDTGGFEGVFGTLGCYGMTAITAVTAQNTLGVKDVVAMTPAFVRLQIDVVAGDIQVDACKTGMLASIELVEAWPRGSRNNKLSSLCLRSNDVSQERGAAINGGCGGVDAETAVSAGERGHAETCARRRC